jgi:hypothetical protein
VAAGHKKPFKKLAKEFGLVGKATATFAARVGARVDYFPHVRPSPNDRRVGIRIRTFEACSGFTLLRPIGSLSCPRPPLSQGSDPASYPAVPPALD